MKTVQIFKNQTFNFVVNFVLFLKFITDIFFSNDSTIWRILDIVAAIGFLASAIESLILIIRNKRNKFH